MAWDEEDVPVILLDEDGPATATTRTVEVRAPRRRRRELALALAALVVVAAVGFVGGDDDDTASPTTPTTKRTTTTQRRSTSSRAPRSTTTTSWPQHVAGEGPLLTSPSGTAVMLVDGGSRVTVVDLDTGNRCTTDPPGNEVWPALREADLGGRAILEVGGGLVTMDGSCGVRDLRRFATGWAVAATADTVWFYDEPGGELIERSIEDGALTGRSFTFPPYQPPEILAAGDRLVAGLTGEVSLLDPADGSIVSLGSGTPIAANTDAVAVVQCPRLRCRLFLVDLDSGDRRAIADITPLPWERASFSPDGRKLRVTMAAGGERDEPVPTIIDLVSGDVTYYDDFSMLAFAHEGGWILGARRGALVAFRDDGETIRLDTVRVSDVFTLLRAG